MCHITRIMCLCLFIAGCGGRDNPYDYARSNQYQVANSAEEDNIEVFCNCPESSMNDHNVFMTLKESGIVDGIVLKVPWSDLEPAPGEFNWNSIDRQIQAAGDAGFLVTLTILSGPYSPRWLAAEGSQMFAYLDRSMNSKEIPLPWDDVFVSRYSNLIENVGKMYDGAKGIKLVRMTNATTSGYEMNFEFAEGEEQKFIASGYSRNNILNSWIAIINAYSSAFKATPVDVDIQPIFLDDDVTYSIIEYALSVYGHRFGVYASWWDASVYDHVNSEVLNLTEQVAHATFANAKLGETSFVGRGSGNVFKKDFRDSLRSARENGISYVELAYEDLQSSDIVDEYLSYVREEILRGIAH